MKAPVKHERMTGDVPARYWTIRVIATVLQLLLVAVVAVAVIIQLWNLRAYGDGAPLQLGPILTSSSLILVM
ncbi:hypothetical protein [Actinomyces sp. S4-C9]|uniref:hypothetical protein n=1 Tax=Actinomyces sp. S4-C9 TaxID=1219581 RepID=UPI0012EBF2AE|nr:hypothetical protein [Actinomyces sp. S4-C9]